MTDNDIRIAIAQECLELLRNGYIQGGMPLSHIGGENFVPLDFINDLNAMHGAAMWLRVNKPLEYIHYTAAITQIVAKWNSDLKNDFCISAHDATARQRAEAFLKSVGKWRDE